MPRPPPQMAPAMPTTTSSSGAQLRSSKRGPWEMEEVSRRATKSCWESKRLTSKHTRKGSGLTYLPLPLEGRGVQAGTTHLSRKTLPLFHVHALLQPREMLCPRNLLENRPCCSCCHGTTRGHQTSLPALGESPPRSPACSFWGWTAPS